MSVGGSASAQLPDLDSRLESRACALARERLAHLGAGKPLETRLHHRLRETRAGTLLLDLKPARRASSDTNAFQTRAPTAHTAPPCGRDRPGQPVRDRCEQRDDRDRQEVHNGLNAPPANVRDALQRSKVHGVIPSCFATPSPLRALTDLAVPLVAGGAALAPSALASSQGRPGRPVTVLCCSASSRLGHHSPQAACAIVRRCHRIHQFQGNAGARQRARKRTAPTAES